MIEPQNLAKLVVKTAFFSFILLLILYIFQNIDNRTLIVFCDVGQGDSAYIRIQNRVDILVDSGPDQSVLTCLGKYMPFFDKTIELAFLSHPQKDHYGGYLHLADRYKISRFIATDVKSPLKSYQRLLNKLKTKRVTIKPYLAGQKINILDSQLTFLWPEKRQTLRFNPQKDDPNNLSQVFVFNEGFFKVLFTGDVPGFILDGLPEQSISNLSILKIPHHGSKDGLNSKVLKLADPKVGVISVGAKNTYGHPHPQIMEILRAAGIKIRRTDINGDIVFKIPKLRK